MILAVLQARVSSTRFPGKVLREILGTPMILRQVERVRRARSIGGLLLATSVDPADDPLALLCGENGVACFRGSLDDVLDRFYQASLLHQPEHVVRLTGDCPLADPALIDHVVGTHVTRRSDYTSNTIPPTYPDGLDIEVIRFSCLEQAWREAKLPSEREHVTPFLYGRPNRYRIGAVRNAVDLSALRWTVDEPDDFELVRTVYEALYPGNPVFTTEEILAFLERNPALKTWNVRHARNEGYEKSLKEDNLIKKGMG